MTTIVKTSKPSKLPLTGAPLPEPAHAGKLLVQSTGTGDFVPLAKEFSNQYALTLPCATAFVGMANDIIQGHAKLSGAYAALVVHIRSNNIGPKAVSQMLSSLGFKKTRVSEINRVAQAPAKLFKALEAKEIGFREALELTRQNMVPEMLQLDECDVADGVKSGAIKDENKASNQTGVKKKILPYGKVFGKLAKSIQQLCVRRNKLPATGQLADFIQLDVANPASIVAWSSPDGSGYDVVVFKRQVEPETEAK